MVYAWQRTFGAWRRIGALGSGVLWELALPFPLHLVRCSAVVSKGFCITCSTLISVYHGQGPLVLLLLLLLIERIVRLGDVAQVRSGQVSEGYLYKLPGGVSG